VDLGRLLEDVAAAYRGRDVAQGKHVTVAAPLALSLESDVRLLRRILGNLVKNALEAVAPGGAVDLSATGDESGVHVTVWNTGCIPSAVQAQIFQRSFTTKRGLGRGIGTYSVQLFTEQVLGGTVDFTSSAEAGTSFRIHLPRGGAPTAPQAA
jgi:signal transduction histidine kinase